MHRLEEIFHQLSKTGGLAKITVQCKKKSSPLSSWLTWRKTSEKRDEIKDCFTSAIFLLGSMKIMAYIIYIFKEVL